MQNFGKCLKLEMNVKCGHMNILYTPMNVTEDEFPLISGNQLPFCDSLNTQFQIFQLPEKGFLFLNFLQLIFF